MIHRLVLEETVGEDGKLIIQLPPESFHGKVKVTIEVENESQASEMTPEEEAALDAEIEAIINDPNFARGLGLTAEEIAKSPEIGMWKDRPEMDDSVAWVAEQRRKSRERRLKRD